ncbi:glycosyltransferase family 4 protein [Teredinibacter haidensis]|uniref:glycosyltransferase family 4 protein n=1 Tax=Teredinibacter haidensis TaxID=2731755 RepID=UPI000948D482|nr:glycosyltransferase family 4 protein [Teredinibacter haidensis]
MIILNIYPGPTYDPNALFKTKCEAFSKFSRGAIVSTSNDTESVQLSNYNAVLVKANFKNRFIEIFRLLKESYRQLKRLSKSKSPGEEIFVICYDPLKSGLIGLLLKLIFRCKLIIEVNGVYNSELNSGKSPKYWLMHAIQQFVMNRANGVKLLFEKQLEGFRIKSKVKTAIFASYTDIHPQELSDNENKLILSIGFPSKIKGFDLLVKAFTELSEKENDWKLKIIGHLSEAEIADLKLISNNNSQIAFSKPVAFFEIPNEISLCTIFVLASRTEGMGRVLLEAAALSRPRLASNIDGIPTVIDNGVDGLLFKPENVADLAEKLKLLMYDSEQRSTLGKNAYSRYNEEFTIGNYTNKYMAFLDKI